MMKRFIRVVMLLCVVTVLLSALSLATIEAKAAPSSGKVFQNPLSSTSCGQWSVVPSPNPNVVPSGLSGVAAVSATDAWAVGSIYNSLYAVTAVSATNVWAVGYYVNTTGVTQTLTEHWNGTSWSVVKSPSPGSGDDLRGVAAVSANDVWATGYTFNGSSIQTLVEHWNGTNWQVVKSPNVGTSPAFSGVAAVSAHDVWAVGHADSNTLIEHFHC